MGNKYAVEVWGKHFGESTYSYMRVHGGESFLRALWAAIKAHRGKKWGFVRFEMR